MLGLAAVLILFRAATVLEGATRHLPQSAKHQVLLHTSSVSAVVALGMLVIIISGGIDLSVGSVVAPGDGRDDAGYSTAEATAGSGLASSSRWRGRRRRRAGGLVNGLAVTGLRVPPFVATLGMFSVARGLAISRPAQDHRFPRSPDRAGWTPSHVSRRRPLSFDPGVWSRLPSPWSWRSSCAEPCSAATLCVGSNEATARLCGVPLNGSNVGLRAGRIACGLGRHLASPREQRRSDLQRRPGAGSDRGRGHRRGKFSGGQGSVSGTLLGVLILAILENGVNLFGVAVEVK